MKVALIHDWLDTYRGGERVLEKIAELFPKAPIYTLFYNPLDLPRSITERQIIVSNLNKFGKFRKLLLPILPAAIEAFKLNQFDLIISSSSCVAKGIISDPDAKHLCYIHSPMRYIWDQRDQYFQGFQHIPGVMPIVNLLSTQLRTWDVTSAQRVDQFVANSHFIKRRVQKYFHRDAEVIHPPVDLHRFYNVKNHEKGDYFLVAGALVSYKKVELAIQACEILGKKLIVAGSGPYEKSLRQIAGKNTEFVIKPSHKLWEELLAKAQALLFPGVEDFGIVPIEAMATGTPVIAFAKGGAFDYIESGINGEMFQEQSYDSLIEVLRKFDSKQYDIEKIQKTTEKFHPDVFAEKIKHQVYKLTGEKF